MIGRVNTLATVASGNTAGSVGSANANFGIWCAHIVVAGNGTMGTNLLWSASISIKDGVTGATDQRISGTWIPAPGAFALVGLAGFASRRRRA
jgi:MYXO-CTERM domain-containing protein